MRYLHFLNLELLFQCFVIVIYSYAVVIAVVEVSLFYAFVPLLLYVFVSYVSLTPPEAYFVTKVLGKNRRTCLARLNGSHFASEGFYPCVAYRAAALDSFDSDDALSALKLCYGNGCKFVHVDVRITRDSVAVVQHSSNATLNSISAEKSIEESSFRDLSTRGTFAENVGSINPPTLDDVIQLCAVLDVRLMINVIHFSYHRSVDSTADIILRLYKNYPFLRERCVIASTNPLLLRKIRRGNKNVVTALQWQSLADSSVTSISWLKKTPSSHVVRRCLLQTADEFSSYVLRNFVHFMVGISAVILPKSFVTPGVVEHWERKNIRCIAAVVNLSSEKWYYEHALGITYLTETVAKSYSDSLL